MIHDDCPTDLLAKERRDTLSAAERRTLQLHLVRCKSCRAWQQLGRGFDDEGSARTDDDAVVRRIADGIRYSSISPISKAPKRSKFGRAATPRWLLLAALTATGAAAATVARWKISWQIPPEVGESVARSTPRQIYDDTSPKTNVALTPVELARRDAPVTTSAASARYAVAPTSPSKPSLTGNTSPVPIESALSLYREANQARRKGDASRAILLFRRLQQAFSRSPEAHLSHVALGGALLDSGAPREALRQFDRYLATSGQQALAAEALYGRARALGALGNRVEERSAWQRLQADFPRS